MTTHAESEGDQFISLSVELHEGGSQGSGYHNRNNPNDIYQRKHLLERGSDFLTLSDLSLAAHGTEQPGGDLATLLIINHHFISYKEDRKFKSANIEFTFHQSPSAASASAGGGGGDGQLELFDIYPKGENPINVTHTETVTKYGAHAGVVDNVTKVSGGVTWQSTSTSQQTKKGVINGALKCTRPENFVIKDIAHWVVKENPDSPGIPTDIRTAILIKRVNDEPFMATFKVSAKVNAITKVKETLAEIFGQTPQYDPVYFNPKLPPKGAMRVPKDLDVTDLGEYWERVITGAV